MIPLYQSMCCGNDCCQTHGDSVMTAAVSTISLSVHEYVTTTVVSTIFFSFVNAVVKLVVDERKDSMRRLPVIVCAPIFAVYTQQWPK